MEYGKRKTTFLWTQNDICKNYKNSGVQKQEKNENIPLTVGLCGAAACREVRPKLAQVLGTRTRRTGAINNMICVAQNLRPKLENLVRDAARDGVKAALEGGAP